MKDMVRQIIEALLAGLNSIRNLKTTGLVRICDLRREACPQAEICMQLKVQRMSTLGGK